MQTTTNSSNNTCMCTCKHKHAQSGPYSLRRRWRRSVPRGHQWTSQIPAEVREKGIISMWSLIPAAEYLMEEGRESSHNLWGSLPPSSSVPAPFFLFHFNPSYLHFLHSLSLYLAILWVFNLGPFSCFAPRASPLISIIHCPTHTLVFLEVFMTEAHYCHFLTFDSPSS